MAPYWILPQETKNRVNTLDSFIPIKKSFPSSTLPFIKTSRAVNWWRKQVKLLSAAFFRVFSISRRVLICNPSQSFFKLQLFLWMTYRGEKGKNVAKGNSRHDMRDWLFSTKMDNECDLIVECKTFFLNSKHM